MTKPENTNRLFELIHRPKGSSFPGCCPAEGVGGGDDGEIGANGGG